MKALDKLLGTISTIYLRISQAILLALVFGILTEVFLRYFLGRGIIGSAELTQLAITWTVFLMAFVLFRTRRHIVVTALVEMLGPKANRVCYILINIAVVVLSVYVLMQIGNVWEFLGLKTPVFKIPDTVFKISPAFCFIPIGLQAILNVFSSWLVHEPAGGVEHV